MAITAQSSKEKKDISSKTLSKKNAKVKNKKDIKKEVSSKNSKKVKSKSASKKSNSNNLKKITSKKTNLKSIKFTKPVIKNKKEDFKIIEYYDLPYRYNQTVVKILSQTPTTLFVYWDISDIDRESYKEKYGENFFDTTKPVLIVHNETMNYSFEVDINDFANSWYLHVNDSKCKYSVELGRKPYKNIPTVPNNYIYISSSNKIEAPNDHILFDKKQHMVYFKNVKTNTVRSEKITANLSFISNMGKIYNIYDFYKKIYNEDNVEKLYDFSNPSSGNPTSR